MKTVTIEKVVYGGDGLARDEEGLVIFVPFTLEGEIVSIEITSTHKNFARGHILEILKESPERRKAPCPYFGRCGGCQLQHMSYEEQLRVKEKQLKEFFPHVLPITPAPKTFCYRKKIAPRKEGGFLGFTGIDNHSFVPIERCLLFSEKPLKEIPLFKDEGPFLINNLSIEMSSLAFCQNFPEQSLNLYNYIKDIIAKEKPPLCITDLYCGIGITTLLAAAYAQNGYGIELNKEAVKLAKKNALQNGIKNAFFKAGKAESAEIKGDLILLNPPRIGSDPKTLFKIRASEAKTVIYTSCNPSTLLRDIKRLEGFTLESCKPFDMFPQTAHVELVAILRR